MLPKARVDGIESSEQKGELIVHVYEDNMDYELAPIAAWLWRRVDGRTTVPSLADEATAYFGNEIERETICCVLDSLAEAKLLDKAFHPPGAARRDLVRPRVSERGTISSLELQSSQRVQQIHRIFTIHNNDKQQEEGRKQEEGNKERNGKFQEQDGKRQQEWNAKEQGNKQEQNAKEANGKRR